MDENKSSLPPGRSSAPLTNEQQMTVSSVFLSYDRAVSARYDERARSHFEVISEGGEKVPVVFFGPDIYPGQGDTLNPNPTLPMHVAVAHEVAHFHRHRDGTQINELGLEHLDEALTSLEAAVKFPRLLSEHDTTELVRDAAYRLGQLRQALMVAQAAGLSVKDFLNPSPRADPVTADDETEVVVEPKADEETLGDGAEETAAEQT